MAERLEVKIFFIIGAFIPDRKLITGLKWAKLETTCKNARLQNTLSCLNFMAVFEREVLCNLPGVDCIDGSSECMQVKLKVNVEL